MTKIKKVRSSSKDELKNEIIQFRIDENVLQQLKTLSEVLQTPPGVLARLWVVERLQLELSRYAVSNDEWRDSRLSKIKREFNVELSASPLLVIHLIPALESEFTPTQLSLFAEALRPLGYKTSASYAGRINLDGYRCQAPPIGPIKAAFQLFKSGTLEWLRVVPSSKKILMGGNVDLEIVEACTSAVKVLSALHVALPINIYISLLGGKEYTFGSSLRVPIEHDELNISPVRILNWNQIVFDSEQRDVALLIKPALDNLWNAAGLESSASFVKGKWIHA